MQTDTAHTDLKKIIERNTELLEENNRLLHKLYRFEWYGFWFRIVWYALLIGLPFALYFYVLEPYFEAMGSSYETFYVGMQEIPGFKQFNETLNSYKK